VIVNTSQTDDRQRHGMVDLLAMSSDSDITSELSRQHLESVKSLELDLRQTAINVSRRYIVSFKSFSLFFLRFLERSAMDNLICWLTHRN